MIVSTVLEIARVCSTDDAAQLLVVVSGLALFWFLLRVQPDALTSQSLFGEETAVAVHERMKEQAMQECRRRIAEAKQVGNIQWLSFADLKITALPDGLDELKDLMVLKVSLVPGDVPDCAVTRALSRSRTLRTLHITSEHPLTTATLQAIVSLPSLRRINLTSCRLVVDDNHRDTQSAAYCSSLDVFNAVHSNLSLTSVKLPSACRVIVGRVEKVFPKANVCVVQVQSGRGIYLGDRIILERLNHSSFDEDGHRWQSQPTIVEGIRTDDHQELMQIVVDEDSKELPLVAIQMNECGKKGDRVVWVGRETALDEEDTLLTQEKTTSKEA